MNKVLNFYSVIGLQKQILKKTILQRFYRAFVETKKIVLMKKDNYSQLNLEINMKQLIMYLLIICSLTLTGCNDENSTEPGVKILNRCGIVEAEGSVRSGRSSYTFEGKNAFSFGFTEGDYVCFEAELIHTLGNHQGGSSYMCKLLAMRKA